MEFQQRIETTNQSLKDLLIETSNELNIPLQDRINRAIAVVAERMKLAYVVEATTLLYSAGGEDITDKVIVVLLALDAKEAGADGASN
jgi:Skp family chaperone for outer membrane proteins